MKKHISLVLVFLMLLSIFSVSSISVSADESGLTFNGFTYDIYTFENETSVTITDYTGNDKVLVVPAKIDGIPVKTVYTTAANDTVEEITFEEGIRELGHMALYEWTALKTVNLPSSLEMLGQSAITHAPNIENVFAADGGEYFRSIDGVLYEKLYVWQTNENGEPDFNLPTIPAGYSLRIYPWAKTDSKYTVVDKIDDFDVIEISERAFYSAKNLECIYLPESIDKIHYAAFSGCKNLSKITFITNKGIITDDEYECEIFGFVYDEVTDESYPDYPENLVIYCYRGSAVDLWGSARNLDIIYLDGNAVTDRDDVSVDGNIENGTILVVEVVSPDRIPENALDILKNTDSVIMDMTLEKDGQSVQPQGSVRVRMKIPTGFSQEKIRVYHISEDGIVTDMNAEVDNGWVTFNTDHFSIYVLLAEKEASFDLGDVNLDGKVNVKDATAIQKQVAGIIKFEATSLAVADYDGDTKITVRDATAIQKFVAGIL